MTNSETNYYENGKLVNSLATATIAIARTRQGYMLSVSGRFDAIVYPAGYSKQLSSLRCSAPVAAIPALSRCFVPSALSQPIARQCFCDNKSFKGLICAQYHRFLYLGFFNSSNRQRCNLQCRALPASKALEEQYLFRSATSTEDLRDASVLRAEAYYEVLIPTLCLHTQAGLHKQYLRTKLQAL